jgi:hypothetical protein
MKSPERAIPCPNKFIEIATPNAGRPALTATGNNTAPIKATAGDGQKKDEMSIINRPMVQNAVVGFFITLEKGEIITSLIPEIVNILLIATIIEITRMVGSSSVIAKIKLLNRLLIESLKEYVDTAASERIPTIHTMVVSRRKSIKPMIAMINAT